MGRKLSLVLLATISALLAKCQDYPEVSREGKEVVFVLEVSASGAHTPHKLFNLTKNPSDEPKVPNYITPLG